MSSNISTIIEQGKIEREFQFFSERGISPYTSEVVKRIIEKPSPCLLVAPTGYGKSVAIPYAIVRAGYKVMVSLPTNALAENLYNNFREVFPTLKIGRAYEREVDIPRGAQIIVVSNGYLKNRLLGFIAEGVCRTIDSTVTDVLFIDEIHLGKMDMSIIVSLWFYCSDRFASTGNIRLPRLLLASATPGKTVFGRRVEFCVTIPEKLFKTVFPIDDHWQKDFSAKAKPRYKAMGELLREIHRSTDPSERIMIFVPGKGEMERVMQAAEGIEDEVEVVKIMSGSTAEDHEILMQKDDPKRLIVLSTPSGDAGMNIDRLVHVIDSMLIKNNVEISNGNLELQVEFISKALSKQRRGRVGRNRPGHYYPFCTKEGYDKLEENYVSEITRLPLYRTILELNAHGLDIDNVLGIYKIPRLKKDLSDLIKWGLLRKSKISQELYPSAAGLFLAKLEIESPRLGSILFAWNVLKQDLATGIILINLISFITSEVFMMPIFDPSLSPKELTKRQNEFITTYYKRLIGRTEVHTTINIWNAMVSEVGVNSSMGDILAWCSVNHLNFKMIRMIIKTMQKTYNELTDPAIDSSSSERINKRIPLSALLYLRRLFEYVYSDAIAEAPATGGSSFTITSTGETVSVDVSSNFNRYNDRSEIPNRIVIIAKRKTPMGIIVTQSLDLDRPGEIEDISLTDLTERLGGVFSHR